MATVTLILNALVALPKIAGYVETFAAAVTMWLVNRSNNETLSKISDAAALGARAQTPEDRYAVAKAWQDALSRSRVSSN